MFAATGDNSVHAAAGWTIAEFNVFGDGGGSQANFNSGAQIVIRDRIVYGGTAPPNCVAVGYTGETNNLNFPLSPPAPSSPGPALLFTENTGWRRERQLRGRNQCRRYPSVYGPGLALRFPGIGRFRRGASGFRTSWLRRGKCRARQHGRTQQ